MHFFQSELCTNVKMSYSRQWSENVQMHLCTFTAAHRELMHLCLTLNRYTPATISNTGMTFSLMPVDSIFSVHCGVKVLHISAFMHFYHSTDNTLTDFNRTHRFRSDLPLGKLNCRVRQKVTQTVVFYHFPRETAFNFDENFTHFYSYVHALQCKASTSDRQPVNANLDSDSYSCQCERSLTLSNSTWIPITRLQRILPPKIPFFVRHKVQIS